MKQISVIGSPQFIIGFQMAGIRNCSEAGSNPLEDIRGIMQNKDIGIVIIEEKLLEKIDIADRNYIQDSTSPVFVPLSEVAEQESLRRLIKKSIGVDLWQI